MKVKIVNKSSNPSPSYSTLLSAGMDLRANNKENIVLKPLERKLVPTGLFIELPDGYEAQIRPRSGMALKHGSSEEFTIESGERICQMVINKHESIEWLEVEVLEDTKRGAGGFGHTGTK
jgi:dUTP pyrophosphatase